MIQLNEEFYEKLKEKIVPYFEEAGCHDFSHTERVYNLAMHIGKMEKADLEILKLASILHDIAHKEQDECKGKICHAKKGAKISRDILEEFGVNKEVIEKVVHCIETHRYRNEKIPESTEAKILYDSDKLDSIGGIGILRAALFGGKIGSVVHNPSVEPSEKNAYTKEDSAYHEFLYKLNKIKDKMITAEGRRIAEERHNFMEEFFVRVNKEVAGEL